MQNNSAFKTILLAGVIALLTACSTKDEPVNTTPVIKFESVTKLTREATATLPKRDSVVVNIAFIDGDGDLGESDSTRIKQIYANQTWGNYQIRTFQFINNRFDEVLIGSNARLFFPSLTGSKNAPQSTSGLLSFSQRLPYQSTSKSIPVKFQVRIRDRNLNESNVIETDTIRVAL